MEVKSHSFECMILNNSDFVLEKCEDRHLLSLLNFINFEINPECQHVCSPVCDVICDRICDNIKGDGCEEVCNRVCNRVCSMIDDCRSPSYRPVYCHRE